MISAVNVAAQTVAANSPVVFGSNRICTGCSARHEPGSGIVVLTKPGIYQVSYNINTSIPTGGTVGPITMALQQNGEMISGTRTIFTPAAVGTIGNQSASTLVKVYPGCCVSISLANMGTQAITAQDANISVDRKC